MSFDKHLLHGSYNDLSYLCSYQVRANYDFHYNKACKTLSVSAAEQGMPTLRLFPTSEAAFKAAS
eukprot:SAG31_NODE_824_length_11760_cov_17.390790_4_plen_65_part_00